MTAATPRTRSRQVSLWRRPLLVGVCFGLGYGITQRLLDLRLPGLVSWGQSFDVREFPGTSLESLRLLHGSSDQELRGTLDLLELQPKKAEPKATPDPSAAAGATDAAATHTEAAVSNDLPDAGPGETRPPGEAPVAPKLPAPAPSQP